MAAIIAFAFLVWPTLWQYDKSGRILVRTERITGEVQVLGGDGWFTTNSGWMYKEWHHQKKVVVQAPPAPQIFLTANELSKLQIDSSTLSQDGTMVVNLYNGSDQTISAITMTIIISDKEMPQQSNLLSRNYRLYIQNGSGCLPQSNGSFVTDSAYRLEPSQSWSWDHIENATIFH